MYVQQPNSQAFSQRVLLQALTEFPDTWVLTPVNGKKIPYRQCWQSEQPVSREVIAKDIRSGKAKGVGLRTGRISGGLVAIDADGKAAHEKILELSGGIALPKTVSFSSNRPGRCQYLFYIPSEYWEKIHTTKIGTGIKGDDGKEQKLELRWDGCQSVLPPSAHPNTGVYQWRKSFNESEIALAPMWVIEQMLTEQVLTEQAPSAPAQKIQFSLSPTKKWTTTDWALSYLNALSPYRTDDYDDWLAVGMALHSVDDALLASWDAWSSQSPKYKPGVCEKKWKSFNSQGISIGSLAHMAKQDGWQSPFNKPTGRSFSDKSNRNRSGSGGSSGSGGGSGGSGSGGGDDGGNGGDGGSGSGGGDDGGNGRSSKVLSHPAFSPLTKDELLSSINSLIQQGTSDSFVSLTIPSLAKRSGYTESAIWKIYYDLLKEIEIEESRTETATLIDSLLLARAASIPLHSLLPMAVADPFIRYAGWLNIRPEVVLLTFLTTVSGLHHSETTSWLNRDFDFDVKPNLFTAIVAPPSQKKSPILKAIAKKPLRVLERKAREQWKRLQEEYKKIEQRYNSLPKEQKQQQFPNGLPQSPPKCRKVYSFSDATTEGIRNQIEAYPEQGLIGLPDELARLIKSANKYRGGKGSDEEDLLSYYDGGGETVLRADGLAGDFDNLLLSILGSIQPGVLQNLIKDCQDENGKWARFIFVNQPLAASTMSADGGNFDLTPMLSDLYEKVNQLPPVEYKPEREAFTYYCSIYNELERRRCTEPHGGLSAAWGKAEGRVGKLACNLHVVHELVAGKTPSEFIPKARYEEAFTITMFGMQQLFSLYKELGEEEALATHLVKVISLSQEKGGFIKAKEVQSLYNTKYRPSPDTVRSWFRELKAMGKGTTRGDGRSLEFSILISPTPPPDNPPKTKVGKVDVLVDVLPTAESTGIEGIQALVGKVGFSGRFSEKIDQCVETPRNNMVINSSTTEKVEICPLTSTLPTNVQSVDLVAVSEVDGVPTETSTFGNPQIELATLVGISEVIEVHCEYLLEQEDVINAAVAVIAAEDSWEGVQKTIELLELSLAQKQEVKRRLVESGHTAKVRELYEKSQLAKVDSTAPEKVAQPQQLFKNGDRVQYQKWHGRFGGYVKSGCLVEWDKLPKSLLKMYGPAPTQPVAESDLVLIKRAT